MRNPTTVSARGVANPNFHQLRMRQKLSTKARSRMEKHFASFRFREKIKKRFI
jgi:hypothetical protein